MNRSNLLTAAITVLFAVAVASFLSPHGNEKAPTTATVQTRPTSTVPVVMPGGAETGANATAPSRRSSTPTATTASAPAPTTTRAATPPAKQTLEPDYAATLAARGFPALADLAVAGDGLKISFVGFDGKQAVVNVRYSGTQTFARTAWLAFLHRYGDTPGHYSVRWSGPTSATKQKRRVDLMPLVLRGFNSLIAVPYSKGRLTVNFVKLQGKQVVLDVSFAGSTKGARAALRRFFAAHSDSPSKYITRLHAR